MVPGSSIVKFDQTPDTYFFLCKKCQTHIAFYGDENIIACELGEKYPQRIIRGPYATMERMDCVGCNTAMGWKYVDVKSRTNMIQEGRCILFLDRLLYWTGVRIKEAVDALAKTE